MSMNDPRAATEVFYDGACPICRREIAVYKDRLSQTSIAWRDVAAEERAAPDLDRAEALARFHVRQADGRLTSGAAAFVALWRNDKTLRPVAVALDNRLCLWFLERVYRGFLAIRPLWRR